MCGACAIYGNHGGFSSLHASGSAGATDPSSATGVAVTLSGNAYIDSLIGGSKWSSPSIDFNFPTSSTYYQAGYGGYADFPSQFVAASESFKTMVRKALAEFASVASITFNEVAATSPSDISVARTGLLGTTAGNQFNGYGYYPGGAQRAGDIWFASATVDVGDTAILGRGTWRLVMHELGHAMGLKHSQDSGGPHGAPMPSDRDFNDYTLMSYKRYEGGPNSGSGAANTSNAQTLMMLDIAALQHMYGANFSTNSGNTTYSFDPNTGQMFINGIGSDLPQGNKVFRTIWDGGGADTYDFSNYTTNLTVDLAAGGKSTLSTAQLAVINTATGQTVTGNVFNALLYQGDLRSLIENANGGSGNDDIKGNQAANELIGNSGNDTLTGSAGADRLFGGIGDDWLYFDGLDTAVNGGDGFDIAIRDDGLSAHGFAMAANGIEELRWNLSGDSYIATRNVATGDIRVVTNDGGSVNSDWSSFTTDYTLAWITKVQQGTYDTGGLWSINYDFASNQSFTSYTTVYKAGSILWYQSGTYDNASTWSINWDTEGAGSWREYTTQYNPAGQATSQSGIYDDNTRWTINWDITNAGTWREYTTIYRANGDLWYQTGIYDNGQTWTIYF